MVDFTACNNNNNNKKNKWKKYKKHELFFIEFAGFFWGREGAEGFFWSLDLKNYWSYHGNHLPKITDISSEVRRPTGQTVQSGAQAKKSMVATGKKFSLFCLACYLSIIINHINDINHNLFPIMLYRFKSKYNTRIYT